MGKRVLIVEDEPHLIELLSFILSREGYDIATALDGEAAVRTIWATSPDLIILDVMLPKMNGFEILKKIKADPRLQSLPVIMLTAKGQRHDRATAKEIGADLFLTKPFSNKAVVSAVKGLMAG